jgi:uncharacterized protein (UPF0254 family)
MRIDKTYSELWDLVQNHEDKNVIVVATMAITTLQKLEKELRQKPPENRAMHPVEETKGLCDECSYYRPLVNIKGHNVCELCVDLH